MGTLYYGGTVGEIEVPDRLLAHLKVVITTKLRRHESFTLTMRHLEGDVGGRSTIWIGPSIPLRFVFDSSEVETLDAELLQRFALDANSSAGLAIDLAAEEAAVSEVRPLKIVA
jgi:hypothetical protein